MKTVDTNKRILENIHSRQQDKLMKDSWNKKKKHKRKKEYSKELEEEEPKR